MRIRLTWLRWLALPALAFSLTGPAFAADPSDPADPEVRDKAEIRGAEIAGSKVVSVRASAVPLGQLLKQFDAATGMKSRIVLKDLENRKVSVRFSNLDYAAAVRKIFQGQPFDYIYIRDQGVVVLGSAQAVSTSVTAPTPAPPPTAAIEMPVFTAPAPVSPAAATDSPEIRPTTETARPLPRNAPLAMPGGGPPGEDTPLLPFSASSAPTAPVPAPTLGAIRPEETAPLFADQAVQGESSMANKPKQER